MRNLAIRNSLIGGVAETPLVTNVTRYGSIRIEDGIVSGFAKGSYIETPQSLMATSSIETIVKYKCADYDQWDDVRSSGCLFATVYNNSTAYYDLASVNWQMTLNSAGRFRCWMQDNWTAYESSDSLEVNKWYWVRFYANAGKWELSYSTDGEAWTLVKSESSTMSHFPMKVPHKIVFGCNRLCKDPSQTVSAAYALKTDIDLSGCSITIDGSVAWQGLVSQLGGGSKCRRVRRSYRRSCASSARFCSRRLWKEVA